MFHFNPAVDPFERTIADLRIDQAIFHRLIIVAEVDGVAMTRQSVWLCHLCGWTGPTEVPEVSTFYAFLRRLYPEVQPRWGALRRSSGRRLKLTWGQKRPIP